MEKVIANAKEQKINDMSDSTREYLASRLREKVPGVKLPTSYEYYLEPDSKTLTLKLSYNGLIGNMQSDESAFESWALVLRYYLSDIIEHVIISWSMNVVPDCEGYLNYNRLEYRAYQFKATYPWVTVMPFIPSIPQYLFCNCPSKEAAGIDKHKMGSEGWLECKYVQEHHDEYDVIDHQFPVGIFEDQVDRNHLYTTASGSAVDIWAIKGLDFYLFELKKANNTHLGIISELMFYTNVIANLLHRRIMYDEDSPAVKKAIAKGYRSFDKFFNFYDNDEIKKIHAIFLADNLHPLITDGLIAFINDAKRWHNCNVEFSHQKLNLSI